VRAALRDSVNLVFVRMMRDIVRYYMLETPGSSAKLLEDVRDERRPQYLARFAEREGSQFIRRYYSKYRNKTPDEALDLMLAEVRLTPERLAVVFNSVYPSGNLEQFKTFLHDTLPAAKLSDKDITALYEKFTPDNYSLPDRGYIARIHPLELWLVGYLRSHPKATLKETLAAGTAERQAVYSWLFNTRYKSTRIAAYARCWRSRPFRRYTRVEDAGLSFDNLIASYATASAVPRIVRRPWRN